MSISFFIRILVLITSMTLLAGCATVTSAAKGNETPLTETFHVKAEAGGQPTTAEVYVTTLLRPGKAETIARGWTTPEQSLTVTVRKSVGDIRVWGFRPESNEKVYVDFPRGLNPWVAGNAAAGFPGLAVGGVEALTPVGKTHNIRGDVILSFGGQVTASASPALPERPVVAAAPVTAPPQVAVPDQTATLLEIERLKVRLLEQQLATQKPPVVVVTNTPTAPPAFRFKNYGLGGKVFLSVEEGTLTNAPPSLR